LSFLTPFEAPLNAMPPNLQDQKRMPQKQNVHFKEAAIEGFKRHIKGNLLPIFRFSIKRQKTVCATEHLNFIWKNIAALDEHRLFVI
jgi:hypothetical protein